MNLLLIDSEIPDLDIFIKSCNSNTRCISYHNKFVSFQMLDKKITNMNISRYNNLGFVFINDGKIDKLFIDNKPFISYDMNLHILENTTSSFIKYLVRKYKISTIDFLACNLLNETIWKKYFDFINSQNNVKVRASDDRTGNLSSGGDWILETTGENVEKIYFNTNIQYWNYLLDNGQNAYSSYILTTDNSNNLYACGRNNSGELGLGVTNSNSYKIFNNITSNIFGKKVISVVAGNEFALLITNDSIDNLYSCGKNNYGQLGLGNNSNTNLFQPVSTNISGKKIINISAGYEHSLILTNDSLNNLYSCGRNSAGQLGLGNNSDINLFQNISINIDGKKIDYISGNYASSYAVTNDSSNNLYVCGRNLDGELGLGNNSNTNTFQNSNINILNKKIIAVTGTGYSSFILTDENENNLYSCGYNDNYGELGLGDNTNRNIYNNVIDNISGNKIIAVSGGNQFCAILTNDMSNNLYTCGKNIDGQLGLFYNSTTGINKFTLSSNTIQNKFYNGISCGDSSLFVTSNDSNNNLYVVGNNSYGQLGLNNTTNINILKNNNINLEGKKIIFNGYTNFEKPDTFSFTNFNYGNNNVTYYFRAQDRSNNKISINVLEQREIGFPTIMDTIGRVYQISPVDVIFSEPISFTIDTLYLSKLYYQYNSNSDVLMMTTDNTQLPYYTYNGKIITIYTKKIFMYIITTVPETKTGSQFSNLKNLIISSIDQPIILKDTKLSNTFFNSQTVINNSNEWDISSSITMASMFRDSSFNGNITNWQPKNVKDMSYMFYGNKSFNKKISYNPINDYWDVNSVENMQFIFDNSIFNNSQEGGKNTEPMNWNLNPNVKLTDNIKNSKLTVGNAQSLTPELLMYINIGILTENLTANNYTVNLNNEDDNIGDSKLIPLTPKYTFLCSRYNLAGDTLWNFKIDCSSNGVLQTQSKLSDGSITTDLNRNIFVSGRWYKSVYLNNSCIFHNKNDTIGDILPYSGQSKQNAFLTKYDNTGNFLWKISIQGENSNCGIMLSNTSSDKNGNIYGIGHNDYSVIIKNSDSVSWRQIGNDENNFNSAWIFKYNNEGVGQWISMISSTGGSSTDGLIINVDSNNNIYGCGSYEQSTNVYDASNTIVKQFLNKGNWISKYDENGSVLWATHFEGTNIITRNIGYSFEDDVYFCGGFTTSTINFVNKTDITFVSISDISNANGFLTKYTSDGICSWGTRNGYALDNSGSGIVSVCCEKQFQDISYNEEGLKFSLYNGYFEDFSGVDGYYGFGFFYKNYPFYKGVTSDFTNLDTATQNQFGLYSHQYISACWYGFFRAKKTGVYTFKTRSDNASYLFINGNLIVNNGGIHAALDRTGTCNLIAGTYYYIQILYGHKTGDKSFEVSYSEPNDDGNVNINDYIMNANGLGIYSVDTEYMGLYDNWINQPMGTPAPGTYETDNEVIINAINENYINLTCINSTNQQLLLYNRPPINPHIYRYIHMKYKSNNAPNGLALQYTTNEMPFHSSRLINFPYIPGTNTNNRWEHIVFDMANAPFWFNENWIHYRIMRTSFGTRNIEFEYFYISDSPKYPLNETGNSIYISGVSKSQNINIYNSSFFYNTTGLGLSNLANRFIRTYTGNNNTFDKTYIVKYDLNGNCIWSIYFNCNYNVRVQNVKLDKVGNVYTFGQFEGTLDVKDKDGNTFKKLISTGSFSTFIACYNENGICLWACKQGSTQKDQVISSSFDSIPLLQGQSLVIS